MIVNKRRFQDLVNPIIAARIPWHSKLGQDGFPRKFVWDGDKNVTSLTDLTVIHDDVTGVPKKITAKDQNSKEITFEVTRDSDTKITATFQYNSNTQATIEAEMLSGGYGNKLKCTATYPDDSDLNFQIDAEYKVVNPSPNTSAWITLAFNGNSYEGWVTPGQEDFPQFLKDWDSDLETFTKQAIVTATNQTFCEPMALPCFQYYSGTEPGVWTPDQQLCYYITVFLDALWGLIGTFIWIVINVVLMYFGVPM